MANQSITADTLTDDQLCELIDLAGYKEWSATRALAYVALHGVIVRQTRYLIKRAKSGAVWRQARERCAEIYNAEILNKA